MKQKFNYSALVASVLLGSVIVLVFSWISGNTFAAALFPTLTLLSGFIITGFIIGIITKEITILEPGLGAIIVSAIVWWLLPAFELHGFFGIWTTDWLIIFMNAIVLTFVGAWLGEKFQHGAVESANSTTPSIEWSWILAGTFLGVTCSVILVNILVLILGANPSVFYIPFFVVLLCIGLVVGWKSPGVTIKEAGIAGFLTITINYDIIRLTLYNDTEMQLSYIIGGLILGFIVTWLGGWVGEKIQARKGS